MTKTIPLTNSDKIAIVSAEDYEQVSQHRWFLKKSSNGWYVVRTVRLGKKFKTIRLHRFVMQAKDGYDIHHRNSDKLDCSRPNLEPIRHTAHANMYYGAEAKMADEYAKRNCTE